MTAVVCYGAAAFISFDYTEAQQNVALNCMNFNKQHLKEYNALTMTISSATMPNNADLKTTVMLIQTGKDFGATMAVT